MNIVLMNIVLMNIVLMNIVLMNDARSERARQIGKIHLDDEILLGEGFSIS